MSNEHRQVFALLTIADLAAGTQPALALAAHREATAIAANESSSDVVDVVLDSLLHAAVAAFKAGDMPLALVLSQSYVSLAPQKTTGPGEADKHIGKGIKLLTEAASQLRQTAAANEALTALVARLPAGATKHAAAAELALLQARFAALDWLQPGVNCKTGDAYAYLPTLEALCILGYPPRDGCFSAAATAAPASMQGRWLALQLLAGVARGVVDPALEVQLAALERDGDTAAQCMAGMTLGAVDQCRGQPESALSRARSAAAAAKRTSTTKLLLALHHHATLLLATGHTDATRYCIKKGLFVAAEGGDALSEARFHLLAADMELKRHDVDLVSASLEQVARLLCASEDKHGESALPFAWRQMQCDLRFAAARKESQREAHVAAESAWRAFIECGRQQRRHVEAVYPFVVPDALDSQLVRAEMELLHSQAQLGIPVRQDAVHRLTALPVRLCDRARMLLLAARCMVPSAQQAPSCSTSTAAQSLKPDYGGMKVAELKALLKQHGLSAEGKKDVLVRRLQSFAAGNVPTPADELVPVPFSLDDAMDKLSLAASSETSQLGLHRDRARGTLTARRVVIPSLMLLAGAEELLRDMTDAHLRLQRFQAVELNKQLALSMQHVCGGTEAPQACMLAQTSLGTAARLQAGGRLFADNRCVARIESFVTGQFHQAGRESVDAHACCRSHGDVPPAVHRQPASGPCCGHAHAGRAQGVLARDTLHGRPARAVVAAHAATQGARV